MPSKPASSVIPPSLVTTAAKPLRALHCAAFVLMTHVEPPSVLLQTSFRYSPNSFAPPMISTWLEVVPALVVVKTTLTWSSLLIHPAAAVITDQLTPAAVGAVTHTSFASPSLVKPPMTRTAPVGSAHEAKRLRIRHSARRVCCTHVSPSSALELRHTSLYDRRWPSVPPMTITLPSLSTTIPKNLRAAQFALSVTSVHLLPESFGVDTQTSLTAWFTSQPPATSTLPSLSVTRPKASRASHSAFEVCCVHGELVACEHTALRSDTGSVRERILEQDSSSA